MFQHFLKRGPQSRVTENHLCIMHRYLFITLI